MIPMEEKLANETRKTDTIPVVLADNVVCFVRSSMATNSLDTILVAIILPA
ncbi:hypothetical protein D3C74_477680 [compost metagenome]